MRYFFYCLPLFLCALTEDEAIYQKISDLYNPTYEDFCLLQKYLQQGERPYLKWLNTFYPETPNDYRRYDVRARQIRFVDPHRPFDLALKQIFFSPPEDKECCVISYASWNHLLGYPQKILEMENHLRNIGFKGHFLYRLGGWPDLEGGSLTLAHIPYSFKVCMFREAKRLGYKKIVWLDSIMQPLRNFDALLETLGKDGYFLLSQSRRLRLYGSEKLRLSCGLTEEENRSIPTIQASLIGIDTTHPSGLLLFNQWYEKTLALDPCLSPRPEQNLLAVLAYQLNLPLSAPFNTIVSTFINPVEPHHYFFLGYVGTNTNSQK